MRVAERDFPMALVVVVSYTAWASLPGWKEHSMEMGRGGRREDIKEMSRREKDW